MTQIIMLKNQNSEIEEKGIRCKVIFILCFVSYTSFFVFPSQAQTYQTDMQEKPEVYQESALRRFEVIFTISMPFTALHSYLGVRGVEMIRQGKISPNLSGANWNTVGGLTILFSGFVAFWDWLHTRGEDTSEIMITPRGQFEPLTGSGLPILNPRFPMFDSRRNLSASVISNVEIVPLIKFLSVAF